MQMRVDSVHLGSIVVLAPEVFEDKRGFFLEEFRVDQFRELGLPENFVQENHSGSVNGVLRGLHFQWDPPMSKLMRVIKGIAFLVAVDIRKNSPTLGKWFGMEVSEENRKQIWAPAGFARGFCVLSDFAEIQYLCTAVYNPKCESGIRWNDPQISIQWPLNNPILSEKDDTAQSLQDWLSTPHSNSLQYSVKDNLDGR